MSQLVALPGGRQLDLSQIPEGERAKVLEQLERVLEANPLDRFYPHSAAQREFLAALTAVVAVFAGNQFGKTTVGVVKNLIDALDRDVVPVHLREFKKWEPPFFCRIIVPAFAILEQSIYPAIQEWCPPSQLLGESWEKAFREGPPRRLRFKNGSYFDFMTYEQTAEGEKKKFGSVRLHRVHYDEEPPQAIRKASQHRLVRLAGDELFTMTPEGGAVGWTYKAVWKRRHEPHVTAVQGDTASNPTLDKETLERLWASMAPDELAMLKRGEFVHIGGLAYPMFPDRVVDADGITPEHLAGQDIVVGIDPGIRFAGLTWTGFDTDNAALTFDELLLTNATAPDYAAAIASVNAKWGIRDPLYVIDPTARNRGLAGGESVQVELQRHDIACVPGYNDRQAGVMQIRRRLAHGGLSVSSACRKLIAEAEEWTLVERPDGTWEPEKGNDHLLDSQRYALMFRPWLKDELPKPGKAGYQPGWVPGTAPAYEPLNRVDAGPMGVYA